MPSPRRSVQTAVLARAHDRPTGVARERPAALARSAARHALPVAHPDNAGTQSARPALRYTQQKDLTTGGEEGGDAPAEAEA
jgi:hypothetical protein